jgi:hypothetical protein
MRRKIHLHFYISKIVVYYNHILRILIFHVLKYIMNKKWDSSKISKYVVKLLIINNSIFIVHYLYYEPDLFVIHLQNTNSDK